MGVPSVPVITTRFLDVARTISYKKGIPKQRQVFFPHPVSGRPVATVNGYLKGKDPVTGKPILEELVEALTKPLNDEEKKTGFLVREERTRLLPADIPTNIQRAFAKNNWTDGLPIIVPTEERVAAMLKGTSRKPDEIVGTMRPAPPHEAWEYTVEMVATNAVMAGAQPEHLPVILALASTGVTSLFSSTTSFARMMVVSGPIRQQLKMNGGIGALGPFNESNAVIGRAWTLISKNLGGGGTPGETYMGGQGSSLNYNNVCFPENEEALPEGWKPLHVQKGFKLEESVVSTFTGWSLINHNGGSALNNQEAIKRILPSLLSSGTGSGSQVTLLLDPIIARDLREFGPFETKDKLSEWLVKNAVTPIERYWRSHQADMKKAKDGIEPFATWLKYPEGALVPGSTFPSPNAIEVLVVGGEANPCLQLGDFSYISSASIDKWK
jgi:hypothetical protein